jgi:hypothetical protein
LLLPVFFLWIYSTESRDPNENHNPFIYLKG